MGQVALADPHRPGRGVDPRRARGDDRRHDREPAEKQLEDIAKPLTAEDAEAGEGDLDLEKLGGEDAAPIESDGAGRFERPPGDRRVEKTGGVMSTGWPPLLSSSGSDPEENDFYGPASG